ncbi:hypothetical protein V866_003851 [Kwoniella sp. B9012]
MKASADYNDLEVWVECDGTRLKEYHQTFEEKGRHQPPIYRSYLEIGDSTNSKYTVHVKNNSITKWLDSLLSNIEVDNYLLCTAYLHPEEGYEVSQSQVYRSEAEKKGDGKVVEHMHSQLVDDEEENSQRIVLLNSPEGSLGRIVISIFRGSLSECRSVNNQNTNHQDIENEMYNGSPTLNVFDPSKIWRHYPEDDVDPWIRFMYTYGTRKALIANQVDLPPLVITHKTEEDQILVPDSTPPSPFAFTSDPDQYDIPAQQFEKIDSVLQSVLDILDTENGADTIANHEISSGLQLEEEGTSALPKVDLPQDRGIAGTKLKDPVGSSRAMIGPSDQDHTCNDRSLKISTRTSTADQGSRTDKIQAQSGPSTSTSRIQAVPRVLNSRNEFDINYVHKEANSSTQKAHPQEQANSPTRKQINNRHQYNSQPSTSLQAEVNRQDQLANGSEYTKLLDAIDNPSSTNLTEKEIDLLLRALTDNQESIADNTGRSHHSYGYTDIPHGSKGKGKEKINDPNSDKDTNTNYHSSNSISVPVSSFERPLPYVSAKDYAYQPSPTIEENDINSLDYLAKEGINEDFLQNLFNADTSPSDRSEIMPKRPKARWETIQSFNAREEDERYRRLLEEKESRKIMQELARRRKLNDKDVKRREGERRKWLNVGKEKEDCHSQRYHDGSIVGQKAHRKRSRCEDEDEIERRIEEKKRRLREMDRLDKVRKAEGRGRRKEEAIDLTLSD